MTDTELTQCRLCATSNLVEVVNLGTQVITSRFPKVGDTSTPSGKIRLVQCPSCKLVQLKDTTPSSEMYEHFYGYRSGINATMRNHLTSYNDRLQEFARLQAGDSVLDIGSNDCTFLGRYPADTKKFGCDPTGTQFSEFYKETSVTLVPTYFTKGAIQTALGPTTRFKAVSSISMFYDLPDPIQFARDIYDLLDDNGVWTLEQSYVATMLERNSIDTICHEHLEYYGVRQMKYIMDQAGFKIIDLSLNECNGGSFRTFVVKKECSLYKEATNTLNSYLEREELTRIHTVERYEEFMRTCTAEVNKLKEFLRLVKGAGKNTHIYGASTKGNCLLQFADIGPDLVDYAVERNALKIGRMTSTGIEIIAEETMRNTPPSYMLVLPWHFRTEIIEREKAFLDGGGQLIFPFPTFEVYSNRPKTLITGISGQIGKYVSDTLSDSDAVYGITRSLSLKQKRGDPMLFQTNLFNSCELENTILLIKPDRIVHLASISNTEDCEKDPLAVLDLNGRCIMNICDIVYRNKLACKVFNASSSELFIGNGDCVVHDENTDFKPKSIYGYSKLVGHQIVDYYRTKYGLPFSNGIIFTSESKYRGPTFLLKKVALHASKFSQTHSVLELGNLDSYRNINHASDIAEGIKCILQQDTGDTYVMCGTDFLKMESIVVKIYEMAGIQLIKSSDGYQDKRCGLKVIHINSKFRNGSVSKINGAAMKLRGLGWAPKYTLQTLLDDLYVFGET